jgi:hypothetical protein
VVLFGLVFALGACSSDGGTADPGFCAEVREAKTALAEFESAVTKGDEELLRQRSPQLAATLRDLAERAPGNVDGALGEFPRRELAVAEMVHVGGQLISMVAVILFLGAGAVVRLSVRRSPLHPIASFLLFVAAAVGSIGLQVELPLAVVLLPALTWSVIAAWLVGAPVASVTNPNPRPASSDAGRCATPG